MPNLNKTIVFLIIYATFAIGVYSQMPTPTPTIIPNIPNGTYDPNKVARDDFERYTQPNHQVQQYYIRNNDDSASYISVYSQSYNIGTMSPGNCGFGFCGSASVLDYATVLPNGPSPSNYGVDIGYYYHEYLGLHSNLAKVTIIAAPQDDAENAGKSCPIVGQPVNVSNGNMWLEQRDYRLPGIGEEIEINRFYNSLIQTGGLFGIGFRTKYDESLEFYGDRLVRLNMPDGRAIYLTRESTADSYLPFTTGFYGFITPDTGGTYTLTFKDGRKHRFSATGKLQWQKDRHGNQTTLNYDTNGSLTGITDSFGRTLAVVMSGGLVQSLSDSLGAVATYTYFTGTSQLKEVTYPDGSKLKFEYDTSAVAGKVFLKTVKDAYDKIIETHDYDSQGRATTSEKEGGVEKYIFDYSTWNNPNPYQNYDPYTLVKHKKKASDPNFVETKYFFDKSKGTNYIWKTEGNCNCGSGAETTTYNYDDRLLLKRKIDALGNQTTYTYNYQGDVLTETGVLGTTTYTRNAYGQILTTTDQMNGVWTNTYDTAGNLLTVTDALNKTTTLTYTTLGQPSTVTDARGKTTTLSYDTVGRLTQVTDADNKTTNYGYDARARVTSVTNALSETTTAQYDLNNRLKKIVYPDAKFVEHTYDLAGRRTKTKDARGFETTFGYDDAYRLTSITDALNHTKTFAYDLMSNLTAQTDALGNTTDYEYDNFNRLKKMIYPPATTGATRLEERMEYDAMGSVKKRIDTANRETLYDYDAAHRLIKTTDALNKATQFEYNNRSQMTKVKDALNQEYVFTYDPLGRRLSQTRAGATMSYEYDAVGNRTKRTDYTGRVTDYTFDNLNRLSQITYNTATPTVHTFTYNALSQMLTAVNPDATLTYTYDNVNRQSSVQESYSGNILRYVFDGNGNRTQLKLNKTVHANYVYDAANRLTTLTDEANQNFTFGYDNADRLTALGRPNGVSTAYGYDGMSRLTELKHQTAATVLADNDFAYNPANQISQIAELAQTRNFTYDAVDRLTQVANPTQTSESYTFDGVGNRTASHLSASYGYQPFNKLVSTTGGTYGYDANGNLTAKTDATGSWTYTWDYENRMTSATNGTTTVAYTYDALGRRIKRTQGASITRFVYDGMDVVRDDANGVITRYQNGPGIDNKLKMIANAGQPGYFLQDHLGSTVGLTNQSGAVTASASYDAFGNSLANTLSTRYQYTGREFDSFTGLYYYRARWYDANLGRFISEDPIGFDGGDINLFGYVWSNPIKYSDPTGLDGWGNDTADWLDDRIEYSRQWYYGNDQEWIRNGSVNTGADLASGFSDMLRVGNGTAQAFCDCDENIYGRAAL